MEKNELLYKALESKYRSQIDEAKATLSIYFTNSVGIGEHPQVMDELRAQIEKLGEARDHIDTIVTLLNKYEYKQQLNG